MAEPLKWHRDAAEALDVHKDVWALGGTAADEKRVIDCASETIAAHDPSAELLRECARAMVGAESQMLTAYEKDAESAAMRARLGISEWESCMPQAWHDIRAALARLADAGVQP